VAPSEGFAVTLSNPSSPATISTSAALGLIENNNTETLAIAATNATQLEGASGRPLYVHDYRSGDTSGAATVNYAVTGSARTSFGLQLYRRCFAKRHGQLRRRPIDSDCNDQRQRQHGRDSQRRFYRDVKQPKYSRDSQHVNGDGLIESSQTLTIAATNATQLEGTSGSTPFTFTITRSGDTSTAATVNYAVTGSGTNPASASNFTASTLPSGTVSFSAGQSTQIVTISVNGSTVVAPSEGFTVTLSNPSSPATLSTSTATGLMRTTTRNDGDYGHECHAIGRDERQHALYVHDHLSGDTSSGATVNYAVTGSGTNPASASNL